MSSIEIHLMTAELISDRRTMRYTCALCHRCIEDGPDGLKVLHRGDPNARHRGGRITSLAGDVEQDQPGAPPVLH
jgi:hypothetical protein